MTVKITAFGALNEDSFQMFREHLERLNPDIALTCAGPYPNAKAVSEPGRPLRAEALQNENKKQELFLAVADDAAQAGAMGADLLCMPCMSMVGFHDGVEKALGLKIERLSDALKEAYKNTPKLGVIHMRPATQRIAEIFGPKAVTPDAEQAVKLLAAEEALKKTGSAAPVETVMKDIAESWRKQGLEHILFARADAPLAEKGPAGKISGVKIRSYFEIMAEYMAAKARALLLPLAALLLFAGHAQAAPVPSVAEPSRAGAQLLQPPPAPLPQAPAPKAAAPQEVAPEGAHKIKFRLRSLHVEGMTVYSDAQIRPLYARLLHKKISFADLYALANALTVKYRNDGYILSQVVVPEQEIKNGHAKLQAVEGFIDQVTVKGSSSSRLREIAQTVTTSKPLNNAALERAILLINDLPGVAAHVVLAPSKTPGAADLTVVAELTKHAYTAETDNRGSRYIGPLQLTGSAQFNDAFGQDESLDVQLSSAPDGMPHPEMALGSVVWSQPLGHDGVKLDVTASVTATQPGYTLKPFEIHGVARAASATLTKAFLRARAENLWAYVKFDMLDSVSDDNLGLGRTVDHVRALRAGATWQFPDRFSGANSAHAELSKGVPFFDASRKGADHLTRAGGDPGFFKGTFELARAQQISGPLSIYTAATGQKAATLLLASEEFGLGGASYGSAYDSSELTGEDGIAGRAELRYDTAVPHLQWAEGYGFYDLGRVWNRDDTVPAHRQSSLADAGAGARFTVNANFSGTAELAFPLTRPVGATNSKAPRLFFSLSAKF